MENYLTRLNFSVLSVNLVSDEDYGDVLANSGQILVPLPYIFVGNSRANIEHEDGTVSAYVVTFSKSTEFLLTSSIPDVELDRATGCVEDNFAYFDSLGCCWFG